MSAKSLQNGVHRPRFIGCACDRKFVEPTATMLTSVDMNGGVADATVIVAGFGLDDYDRGVLRTGAGRLGARIRFLDVTREMVREVDTGGYTDAYPLPVLGRLFIPDRIETPGARLLTLDSDMIVNVSLEPLFELDLGDEFLAAIHDPPADHDPDYFNSGLMMFDVGTFRHNDIANRSLRWLAEQVNHPRYPDQDALNTIVGHRWHRLERRWNHFCYAPLHFEPADWEGCNIAHFAGPKPWDFPDHAARGLYDRYNGELRRRIAKKLEAPVASPPSGPLARLLGSVYPSAGR